jgi:hypothetical protein
MVSAQPTTPTNPELRFIARIIIGFAQRETRTKGGDPQQVAHRICREMFEKARIRSA